MGNWHYFIFLTLLVPRMKAKVESISELFKEIDELYGKLPCPEGLIKSMAVDLDEVQGEPNPNVDLETRMNAYVRYQLIDKLRNNPELAKKCDIRRSLKAKKPTQRTLGLVADVLQFKLCLVMTLVGRCIKRRPDPWGSFNDESPGPTNINVIFPSPIAAPSQPDQQNATCSPFEQNILLPSGKLEKQQLLNCIFPNQTKVLVPMPQIENNIITTNSSSKDKKINGSGKPDIMVIQDVKIAGNYRKP